MIALLAAGILAAALSPASATPPGTTGVEFLEIPVGARPAGMSESFTGPQCVWMMKTSEPRSELS